MRNSGIKWIGNIPPSWDIVRLKSLFDFGKGLPITKEDLLEQGVPVISYGQIHAKFNNGIHIDDRLLRFVSESYVNTHSSSLVDIGDILVADTSEDIDGCGNAVLVDREITLFAGYHTILLKSKERRDNRYLAYMMLTDSWRSQLREKASGVKVFSISKKMLSECYCILPPYSEQERISNFLDKKCSYITNIIEKTKDSVENYKKLRQAIITHAVTKGVREDRPMKESGIEWTSEIPDNWIILSLKYLCYMQSGKNVTSEQIAPEGNYPVYGGNGIRGYYSEFNTEGDHLIVGRQGALCGNVHLVNGKFWATEHAVVTTPTELSDLRFLYYLLIGMNLNQYASNAAAQPGLAVNTILNVKTCLVPLDEQIEIVTYLDEKCLEIDTLIAQKEDLLTALEAYRRSMIYEYVTGKKEVVLS